MKVTSLCLFTLVACDADTPARTSDTSPDTSEASASETSVAETIADADEDLGPPPEPEAGAIALDWVVQSDSIRGSTLYPSVVATDDGGLVVVAGFDHTVRFGGLTLVAPDDALYTHALYTRVTADGQVAALTSPCSDCIGLGGSPLVALPDQRVALAAVGDDGLRVRILRADGTIESSRLIATAAHIEPRAIIVTPEGFVVAGHGGDLAVVDGPTFRDDEQPFYPGRAFVIGLAHDLTLRFADVVGGSAGSTIGLLHQDGARLVAVGDFGGYPHGATSIFGPGTPASTTLASVSSDDDPAMDIFVTAWDLTAVGTKDHRPAVQWARRIAHYSNGPRTPTWIRSDGDGLALRIDSADRIVPDEEGHLAIGYPEAPTLIVRLDGAGRLVGSSVVPAPVLLRPGGFASLTSTWAGSTITLGANGPTFSVPANEPGPDGTAYAGHVLADFRADLALARAGMLLVEHDTSVYTPHPLALLPASDGSSLVVLHGSAEVTLVPGVGAPVTLTRSPEGGYERLIIMRARVAHISREPR